MVLNHNQKTCFVLWDSQAERVSQKETSDSCSQVHSERQTIKKFKAEFSLLACFQCRPVASNLNTKHCHTRMGKSQKVNEISDTTAISSLSSCQHCTELMASGHCEDKNHQVFALHSTCIFMQVNKSDRKEKAGIYLMQTASRGPVRHQRKKEKCYFNLGSLYA